MKKSLMVFLIVFAFFASAGITLEGQLTPFFRDLFNSVSALSSPRSAQTPAAAIENGDVNGDGRADFADLWTVAQGWGTKSTSLDMYRDGKINALDTAVVLNNMVK